MPLRFSRYNEERVEGNIDEAVPLDEVVDFDEFVKVFFDREIGNLPGNGLQVIDNGANVVKARDGKCFLLLDNLPAGLCQLLSSEGEVPGGRLLRAGMDELFFAASAQQFMKTQVGLVADLLGDEKVTGFEDAPRFVGVIAAMPVDDEVERVVGAGKVFVLHG